MFEGESFPAAGFLDKQDKVKKICEQLLLCAGVTCVKPMTEQFIKMYIYIYICIDIIKGTMYCHVCILYVCTVLYVCTLAHPDIERNMID